MKDAKFVIDKWSNGMARCGEVIRHVDGEYQVEWYSWVDFKPNGHTSWVMANEVISYATREAWEKDCKALVK